MALDPTRLGSNDLFDLAGACTGQGWKVELRVDLDIAIGTDRYHSGGSGRVRAVT
jgi:hypothetical protein